MVRNISRWLTNVVNRGRRLTRAGVVIRDGMELELRDLAKLGRTAGYPKPYAPTGLMAAGSEGLSTAWVPSDDAELVGGVGAEAKCKAGAYG